MASIAGAKKRIHLQAAAFLTVAVFAIALLTSFSVCSGAPQSSMGDTGYFDTEYLRYTGYQIPEKGSTLFIDLDNCNMIVFIDGKPYKAYPVSGGSNASPSPVGTWRVREISNWGEGFGGSWIGLNVPWGLYGIHGTVEPWHVGEYNVSHGCIRMRDKDVAELKKLVSYGTVVHIKNDSMPFRVMKNGMVGSDVQKTQKMLKFLGYYYGSADGIFGSAMEHAVRSFQKANSFKEDGIVGRRTYEKICALSDE